MKTIYEKSCDKQYLEKYAKNGNLIRTAEQYDSGVWIISDYHSKINVAGEYTNKEFNQIRKKLFSN